MQIWNVLSFRRLLPVCLTIVQVRVRHSGHGVVNSEVRKEVITYGKIFGGEDVGWASGTIRSNP